MDPTPRSARRPSQVLLTPAPIPFAGLQAGVCLQFRARRNHEWVPNGGHLPEELYSDADKSSYMQHDHQYVDFLG